MQLLHYILEVKIVCFTPHLSDSFRYFSCYNFSYPTCPVKTMFLQMYWFWFFFFFFDKLKDEVFYYGLGEISCFLI